MKTALVSLGLLVLLGGCSATPAPPGASPTPSSAATPTPSPTASPSTASASPTPTPTPTKDAPKDPVSLDQPYTYSDGLKVEVVKVKLSKLSEEGGMDSEYAVGVPIQIVSVLVTNGSGAVLNLDNSDLTMTYGSKKEASQVDDVGTKTLYGKLKAGVAKTGRYGFVAPEKDIDAVTLRFAIDSFHPAARFRGSLR